MAVTTGRLRRAGSLAAIPAGMGVRSLTGALRVAAGADREIVRAEQRAANADALRSTLGGLKGGALKAGQLLSTVDSLFPADPDRTWATALTDLQESNAALDFGEIEAVLRADLGSDWRLTLTDLDPSAVAAASLGQVHRARHEGRDVAVKVQYPGVAEAVASDVAMLGWMLRAGRVVARGLVVPPVVAELRARLTDELDYLREAAHQNAFADAFEADDDVFVPRARLATPRVLVTDWLDAAPLVTVASSADAGLRDRMGQLYQRFLLSAPTRAGLLHADPHPGNFRVLSDGRLGVLDFGAVLPTPGGMPESFGRLIAVMLATNPADMRTGLMREGFVRPGADLDVTRLAAFLAPFTEPARSEVFNYSPEWLRAKFTGGPDDPRNPDYAVAMKLTIPAEQLLTHRVWLGCVGVLCRLRSTVEVAPELRRWLPGFSRSPENLT